MRIGKEREYLVRKDGKIRKATRSQLEEMFASSSSGQSGRRRYESSHSSVSDDEYEESESASTSDDSEGLQRTQGPAGQARPSARWQGDGRGRPNPMLPVHRPRPVDSQPTTIKQWLSNVDTSRRSDNQVYHDIYRDFSGLRDMQNPAVHDAIYKFTMSFATLRPDARYEDMTRPVEVKSSDNIKYGNFVIPKSAKTTYEYIRSIFVQDKFLRFYIEINESIISPEIMVRIHNKIYNINNQNMCAKFTMSENTIDWDPNSFIVFENENTGHYSFEPPFMVLAHEIIHRVHAAIDPDMFRFLASYFNCNRNKNPIEYLAVRDMEERISNLLGERYRERYCSHGRIFFIKSETDLIARGFMNPRFSHQRNVYEKERIIQMGKGVYSFLKKAFWEKFDDLYEEGEIQDGRMSRENLDTVAMNIGETPLC